MTKNRFGLSIIVSLLLHFAFFGVVRLQPAFLRDTRPKQKVEIEIVSMDELDKILQKQLEERLKGQIVEQNDSVNKEKPKDAKFLSKQDQQVEKETVAMNNGRFQNTAAQNARPQQPKTERVPENMPEQVTEPKEATESKADRAKNPAAEAKLLTHENGLPALKDLKPQFKLAPKRPEMADGSEGGDESPSATDDHLQNVPKGMQTLLNTREFVYYSYYNRIKDRLRQYWEPKIKEKMERILREGRTIASSSNKVTKVIIILDNKGILVGVQVVGASGVKDLDEAAIEAFRAAAPFPNPPKGIVEEDGRIRIRWDFILEASTRPLPKTLQYASR